MNHCVYLHQLLLSYNTGHNVFQHIYIYIYIYIYTVYTNNQYALDYKSREIGKSKAITATNI